MASWIKLCTYLVHRYLTKRRDLGTCKKSYHVATRHSCQFLKPLEWKYLGSRVSGSPKSGTTEVIASRVQPIANANLTTPKTSGSSNLSRTFLHLRNSTPRSNQVSIIFPRFSPDYQVVLQDIQLCSGLSLTPSHNLLTFSYLNLPSCT